MDISELNRHLVADPKTRSYLFAGPCRFPGASPLITRIVIAVDDVFAKQDRVAISLAVGGYVAASLLLWTLPGKAIQQQFIQGCGSAYDIVNSRPAIRAGLFTIGACAAWHASKTANTQTRVAVVILAASMATLGIRPTVLAGISHMARSLKLWQVNVLYGAFVGTLGVIGLSYAQHHFFDRFSDALRTIPSTDTETLQKLAKALPPSKHNNKRLTTLLWDLEHHPAFLTYLCLADGGIKWLKRTLIQYRHDRGCVLRISEEQVSQLVEEFFSYPLELSAIAALFELTENRSLFKVEILKELVGEDGEELARKLQGCTRSRAWARRYLENCPEEERQRLKGCQGSAFFRKPEDDPGFVGQLFSDLVCGSPVDAPLHRLKNHERVDKLINAVCDNKPVRARWIIDTLDDETAIELFDRHMELQTQQGFLGRLFGSSRHLLKEIEIDKHDELRKHATRYAENCRLEVLQQLIEGPLGMLFGSLDVISPNRRADLVIDLIRAQNPKQALQYLKDFAPGMSPLSPNTFSERVFLHKVLQTLIARRHWPHEKWLNLLYPAIPPKEFLAWLCVTRTTGEYPYHLSSRMVSTHSAADPDFALRVIQYYRVNGGAPWGCSCLLENVASESLYQVVESLPSSVWVSTALSGNRELPEKLRQKLEALASSRLATKEVKIASELVSPGACLVALKFNKVPSNWPKGLAEVLPQLDAVLRGKEFTPSPIDRLRTYNRYVSRILKAKTYDHLSQLAKLSLTADLADLLGVRAGGPLAWQVLLLAMAPPTDCTVMQSLIGTDCEALSEPGAGQILARGRIWALRQEKAWNLSVPNENQLYWIYDLLSDKEKQECDLTLLTSYRTADGAFSRLCALNDTATIRHAIQKITDPSVLLRAEIDNQEWETLLISRLQELLAEPNPEAWQGKVVIPRPVLLLISSYLDETTFSSLELISRGFRSFLRSNSEVQVSMAIDRVACEFSGELSEYDSIEKSVLTEALDDLGSIQSWSQTVWDRCYSVDRKGNTISLNDGTTMNLREASHRFGRLLMAATDCQLESPKKRVVARKRLLEAAPKQSFQLLAKHPLFFKEAMEELSN